MKKSPVSLLLIMTIVGAIFISNAHSTETVTTSKWYTKASSFEKIEEAAKKKDKPYMFFVYTDWCGFCKKMNKKYFSNPEIKQILSKYYRIKINPDKGEEEKALANKKGVNGYPDFRVVHPDGRTIKIHPFRDGGSLKVKAFIRDLKAALKG
ncbi:Thioredoxin-like domain-containing protein [Candidatus Electrothrix aarhusensis]|jgi:thiol:disulfide interchange protein|uniref:Thioredoxin-like domain-containing protein n=1 Tax=Candidatus Electrothrix aarhusensis TaxID=1859131 RepID=A0A444J3F0_9BACT|nr:Thioredoxin-like domain-containing protein [Candidatus Electrothrix aarhusensis]